MVKPPNNACSRRPPRIRIDEYIDEHFDLILTATPCGSGDAEQIINTGHMLVQNTKSALSTLRSVWGLWNHTTCKYGDDQRILGSKKLCRSSGGRAVYWQGFKGALMSVLGNCEACSKKTKYTGFRTFNSLYPCHAPGDLVVHLPGLNESYFRQVVTAFLEHANLETGTFDEHASPLLSPGCPRPSDHACSTREACDRQYHGLNAHGKCPAAAAKDARF